MQQQTATFEAAVRGALSCASRGIGAERLAEAGLPADLGGLLDARMLRAWQASGASPSELEDHVHRMVDAVLTRGQQVARPRAWLHTRVCALLREGFCTAERAAQLVLGGAEQQRQPLAALSPAAPAYVPGRGGQDEEEEYEEEGSACEAFGPFQCGWELARALAAGGDFETLGQVVGHAAGFLDGMGAPALGGGEQARAVPLAHGDRACASYHSARAFGASLAARGDPAAHALRLEELRWRGVLAFAGLVRSSASEGAWSGAAQQHPEC